MTQFGAPVFTWRAEWISESAAAVIAGAAEAGLDIVEIPLLRPEEFDAAVTPSLHEHHGVGPPASSACRQTPRSRTSPRPRSASSRMPSRAWQRSAARP